jgi:hypothetical protein
MVTFAKTLILLKHCEWTFTHSSFVSKTSFSPIPQILSFHYTLFFAFLFETDQKQNIMDSELLFFYFWFIYSFIHMCIHCLGHLSPTPNPVVFPPTSPCFQAELVLPSSSPILLRDDISNNKKDTEFWLV